MDREIVHRVRFICTLALEFTLSLVIFSACGRQSNQLSSYPQVVSQSSVQSIFDDDLPYFPNRIIIAFNKDFELSEDIGKSYRALVPSGPLYQNEESALFARYLADELGLALSNEVYVEDLNFASYQVPESLSVEELINSLPLKYPNEVRYVEYDGKAELAFVPNDPFYPDDVWGLVKVNPETAWDYTVGDEVYIGVIDSGIRMNNGNPDHEDLMDNVYLPEGFTLDLVNNDAIPEDTDGHGTHVAGIASAVGNNSLGLPGVAFAAKIVPIRVLVGDEVQLPYSRVIQAIQTAVQAGCKVINMSLGGSFLSKALQETVEQAYLNGVLLVAAAMNRGNEKMIYPAAYEEVIAVGATDPDDKRASFSNYGEWVDIAAPGTNILSTLANSSTSYGYKSGTSMASPLVAGAGALLWGLNPDLSVEEVKAILEASGDDLVDSEWNNPDIKRLNVSQAVNYSLGSPPTVQILSPSEGQVSGVVDVTVSATDSDGTVKKATFYVGSYFLGVDRTEPFSVSWNTENFPNKQYTLKVIATDDDSQIAVDTVEVTVNNSEISPDYWEDFESGENGWWIRNDSGNSFWHISTEKSNSPTHSFKFGSNSGGVYQNNEFDLLFSPSFNLNGLEHVKIEFNHFEDFNIGDTGYVAVNIGDGEYYLLESFSDLSTDWGFTEVSLDDFIGNSVQIVFIAETDGFGVSGGWWIDDFRIRKSSDPPTITLIEPVGGEVSGTIWVRANASDDVSISKVEFYVDNQLKFTDTSAPYQFQLDTTTIHGGDRKVKAVAYDEYPLTASDEVTVTVKNHSISSFAPSSATADNFLNINGSLFIENGVESRDPTTDKVYFTGVSGRVEAQVSSWRRDRITVVIPKGAVDGVIYVDIGSASVNSSTAFTILPKIDVLVPNAAYVGDTIEVVGSGFLAEMSEESEVSFGALIAENVLSWSTTSIMVEVPKGVKPSLVTVKTKNGTSTGVIFTPIPRILELSRYWGHPGAELTIRGTSFGDFRGSSVVVFAPNVQVPSGNFLSWNDSEIILIIPSGAETGPLRMLVNGNQSNAVEFTITLPPPRLNDVQQF